MDGTTAISGSTVKLYAAGTAYGSGAVSLATATTGADGSFTLAKAGACPEGNPQTYVTATGGNAGSGLNSAIGLMGALGPCGELSASTHVIVNELTTAVAQWALAQFFDSSGHTIGVPAPNAIGLQNAYLGSANLADTNASNFSMSGNPSGFLPSGGSCPGSSNCDALRRLNTLANILAGCVGSTGPSSNACAALMCDATPGLTFTSSCSAPPAITDTLGAAHLIVTNPANKVTALFGLAASTPFSPVLASAPDGWEMELDFAPAGAAFNSPSAIALDGSGNVFAANRAGSVSELTAASSYATGFNFAPAGAAFDIPGAIALDGTGNVFVANMSSGGGGSVSELTASSIPPYSGGSNFAPSSAPLDVPSSIALDGSGNLFLANSGDILGSVSELTESSGYKKGNIFYINPGSLNDYALALALDGTGNVLVASPDGLSELAVDTGYFPEGPFNAASFDQPTSVALDASADVFVANSGTNTVSELIAGASYEVGFNLFPTGAALDDPVSMAVDGSGNLFVANEEDNSVSEVLQASGYGRGFNFAPAGTFSSPDAIAADASGNIFVANGAGNSVSELMGLAVPVITPIQSALPPGVQLETATVPIANSPLTLSREGGSRTAGSSGRASAGYGTAIKELISTAAKWALAQFFDSTADTAGATSTNATGPG
jgi:hypothetical protein